jgi:hypothetical protein
MSKYDGVNYNQYSGLGTRFEPVRQQAEAKQPDPAPAIVKKPAVAEKFVTQKRQLEILIQKFDAIEGKGSAEKQLQSERIRRKGTGEIWTQKQMILFLEMRLKQRKAFLSADAQPQASISGAKPALPAPRSNPISDLKTMSRSRFEALPPKDQLNFARAGGKLH